MKQGRRSVAAMLTAAWGLAALIAAGCGGGGSSPAAPSPVVPSPNVPASGVCSAIGGSTAIVNGTRCAGGNTSLVLLDMRDERGFRLSGCSGTVIARRGILTAAHCLDGDVATVSVFPIGGRQILAQSFAIYEGYREQDTGSDVGVVLLGEDVDNPVVPLLLSRDARVGEEVIISGWGMDQNSAGSTLRAGLTLISAVTGRVLQTEFSQNTSAVCGGDSGGALLASEGGVWAIAGVISANTTTFCQFGTNFYANVRNPPVTSFILDRVPDATSR